MFSVKFKINSWLKASTSQGSELPESQREFVDAGTVLPVSHYETADNNHIRLLLEYDPQGRQVQPKRRIEWYVYKPHADILLNGVPVDGYTLKAKADTWLKQTEDQAIDLPSDKKHFIPEGTVLPISGFKAHQLHLRFTLGKDETGNQMEFRGLNTWFVYTPHIGLLHNGKPYTLEQVTNEKGLRLIKSFEGLRLTAYQDAVGVWTIGYGTTSKVYPGMVISQTQAEEFLRQDLQRFEAAVRRFVKVSINSDQFSALVAFTYNVGEGALARSTLLRKLNGGIYTGAADEFLNWVYAGGRVLAGLVRRRNAERALFLGEDFTTFL